MRPGPYAALAKTRHEPVQAWEAIMARATDPKDREHMRIAIAARKRLEEAKSHG
jgi:hypothetical protein